MTCNRTDIRGQLDRIFVHQKSIGNTAKLRRHVTQCDDCAGYYHRLMSLHSHLEGDALGLSELQLEWLLPAIKKSLGQPAPKRRASVLGALGALTALGAAAALLLVAVPKEEEFQARQGAPTIEVGIRGACGDAHGLSSTFSSGGAPGACGLGDILTLSYTNAVTDGGYPYLFVVGVDESNEPLWYYPTPSEGQSLQIQRGRDAVDISLPGGIRLSVNHHPGRVRMYGVFSKTPITTEAVQAWVTSGASEDAEFISQNQAVVVSAELSISHTEDP